MFPIQAFVSVTLLRKRILYISIFGGYETILVFMEFYGNNDNVWLHVVSMCSHYRFMWVLHSKEKDFIHLYIWGIRVGEMFFCFYGNNDNVGLHVVSMCSTGFRECYKRLTRIFFLLSIKVYFMTHTRHIFNQLVTRPTSKCGLNDNQLLFS